MNQRILPKQQSASLSTHTLRLAAAAVAVVALISSQGSYAQQQKSGGVDEATKRKWAAKRNKTFRELTKPTEVVPLSNVPAGFPVPVYSGEFKYGNQRKSLAGKYTSVTVYTKDNVGSVIQWYRQSLEGAGFKVSQRAPGSPGASGELTGHKIGMLCRVQAMPTGGGTQVAINLTQKE